MTAQPNTLPTQPEELSSFHSTRSTLYRALFELLRMPPRAATFEAVIRTLEAQAPGHHCAAELVEGLRGADLDAALAEYGQLFAAPQPVVAMRCRWPNCGVRDSAFNAADTLPGSERVSELHVISVLAERTAQAFAAGRSAEAAAFSDAQAKLLSFHAGACLSDMAGELRSGKSKLYVRVGQVLGCLVEHDLKLLGHGA